jgi:hypothetical protein
MFSGALLGVWLSHCISSNTTVLKTYLNALAQAAQLRLLLSELIQHASHLPFQQLVPPHHTSQLLLARPAGCLQAHPRPRCPAHLQYNRMMFGL